MLKYILVLIYGLLFPILAGEHVVNKERENMVKFISDAPIEDFEGVTSKIDGFIFWEGEDLLNKSEIYFEVDLNSVDTGIGLRNRHMRENYLHTEKFPFTHFKGKLEKAIKVNDTEYQVRTRGKIFIHGIEKELETAGKLVKTGEKEYQVTVNFQVKLTDFEIEVPSIMFYKINETMELYLNFFVIESE